MCIISRFAIPALSIALVNSVALSPCASSPASQQGEPATQKEMAVGPRVDEGLQQPLTQELLIPLTRLTRDRRPYRGLSKALTRYFPTMSLSSRRHAARRTVPDGATTNMRRQGSAEPARRVEAAARRGHARVYPQL